MAPAEHASPQAQATWRPPRVAVFAEESAEPWLGRAAALAAALRIPWSEGAELECDLLLVVSRARLELRSTGAKPPGPVFVDLISLGRRHLGRRATLLKQPIARAVAARGRRPTVLDATAGLGRDAWLLACLGCQVTAVERSPIVGALLQDGLERAARHPQFGRVIRDHLTLRIGDARQVLDALSPADRPEVVFLDPMFAPNPKSAEVKKEMRVLRRLVGEDSDAGVLLATARSVAGDRVVVKRMRHAPPLAPEPDMAFRGKIARYDVYLRPRRC